MAFEQFKLDRAVNQSRGIFDVYIYRTEDTSAQVQADGYFSDSRFKAADPDQWSGGIIEVIASDGYVVLQIDETGNTASMVNMVNGMNSTQYNWSVAAGLVDGIRSDTKFGRNPDVDTASEEDIWTPGGNYQYQSSAVQLDVSSDNANDALAGSGARTLEISGLDGNYDEVSEIIELNGLAPVTTANSYLRNFRMRVITAGTEDANEGTLTAVVTGGGVLQSQIEPNNGQTEMTHLTVPRGKKIIVTQFTASISSGDQADVYLDIRVNEIPDAPFLRQVTVRLDETASQFIQPIGAEFNELTDIRFRARSFNNNAAVAVSYEYALIDDGALQ